MKTSLERVNGRHKLTEEGISKLEERLTEFTQTEKQKENNRGK